VCVCVAFSDAAEGNKNDEIQRYCTKGGDRMAVQRLHLGKNVNPIL